MVIMALEPAVWYRLRSHGHLFCHAQNVKQGSSELAVPLL